MARIPRQPIQDFTLAPVPGVVSTVPVDTTQLAQFGRILMNEGLTQAAENAKKEGIRAQAQVEDGTLVKRDSSFFGFFDAQFDEGAKYMYQKQKQLQIDNIVEAAQTNNPWDPQAYDEEILAAREAVFDGVPADSLPGVKFYWDSQVSNTGNQVTRQGVLRELKFQGDQLALDVDEAAKAAEKAMELTGEIPVEIEARLTALKERAAEIGQTEAQIMSMETAVRDRVFISSKIHEYRQLPAGKRASWMNNLLSEKGPLKEKSYLERLSIHNKIAAVADTDKAKYATEMAALNRKLKQGEEVINNGHNWDEEAAVLTQAQRVYAETGDKTLGTNISNFVDTKLVQSALTHSRGSNMLTNQETIAALQEKKGLSLLESKALLAHQADLEEKIKVNRDGNWLDYVIENNVDVGDDFDQLTRGQQVDRLAALYGQYERDEDGNPQLMALANVNYYRDSEMKDMKERYANGTFLEKADIARKVGEELQGAPRHRDIALRQIADSEHGLGVVANLLANPETQMTGLAVLNGMEVMEGAGKQMLTKMTDSTRNAFSAISSVFPTFRGGGVNTSEGYTQAVLALWANTAVTEGKAETAALSSKEALDFFHQIVGGETWVMPSGERAVPLRQGFTSNDNKDYWSAMNDETLKKMGGGKFPVDRRSQDFEGNQVPWDRIRADGRLQPTGRGNTFFVIMPAAPGSPMSTVRLQDASTGRAFIFDADMMLDPPIQTDSPLIESMP